MSCAAAEPAGVTCAGGVIGNLTPGSTYSATEVQTPPGYATPATQTFAASTDGSATSLAFADSYKVGNYTSGTGARSCSLCILSGTGTSLTVTGSSQITWTGSATNDSTSASATTGSGTSKLSGQSFYDVGGVKLSGTATLHTSNPAATGTASDPFSCSPTPPPAAYARACR